MVVNDMGMNIWKIFADGSVARTIGTERGKPMWHTEWIPTAPRREEAANFDWTEQ
jgi:hypothetical protein